MGQFHVLTANGSIKGTGAQGPAGTDTRVYVFTSRPTPATGDQLPEFYADRAVTLDFVQASGAARVAAVTVDLKKNGTSVFPVTTKPDAPLAGGLGTRRVPDTTNVAQGDKLTVNFASTDFSDTDKIVVYIGAH